MTTLINQRPTGELMREALRHANIDMSMAISTIGGLETGNARANEIIRDLMTEFRKTLKLIDAALEAENAGQ